MSKPAKKLVTVRCIEAAHARGQSAVALAPGSLVTPLARDVARRLQVRLETERSTRRQLVFGNWKANGTAAEARARAEGLATEVATAAATCDRGLCVFPPFPHLAIVGPVIARAGIPLGAQDVSSRPAGATTGAVPASMLKDLGVTHVLIGHSERRHVLGDDLGVVRAKLRRACDTGLVPVLCIGETLSEREAGRTQGVLRHQLLDAVDRLPAGTAARMILAYEPVWAIGTGLTPTLEEIDVCLGALRDHLARRFDDATAERVPILYGGSVKPSNARAILGLATCDGALVGGASLKPASLAGIAGA